VKDHYDIVVVGAGPAGMAAATVAAEHGVGALLLDEQSTAGGQIYRAVSRQALNDGNILGPDYYHGRELVSALQASGAEHVTGATVWQLSPQREIGVSKDGIARLLSADQVILATGAQERPFPVPGWTLAGVMTAGGAQVLLKSAALAEPDAVFAGTGPLLYLVASQAWIRAGFFCIRELSPTSIWPWLPAAPTVGATRSCVGTPPRTPGPRPMCRASPSRVMAPASTAPLPQNASGVLPLMARSSDAHAWMPGSATGWPRHSGALCLKNGAYGRS
jgi:hypothetical protein